MKRLLLVAALALGIGGCAQLNTLYQTATTLSDASVSPTAVIVAANSFDAIEVTATNYLTLPKCPKATICRDPQATKVLIPAIKSGRIARNNLKAFLRTHPGQLGSKGLYDALNASITTIQGVINQYNIRG